MHIPSFIGNVVGSTPVLRRMGVSTTPGWRAAAKIEGFSAAVYSINLTTAVLETV
jgi:hypothetical protein